MQYEIPFVNFGAQYLSIKKEIIEILDETLTKGNLILRDELQLFEETVANKLGVKYAIGVNSGTDALFFSLKSCGIGERDEVITVANTHISTIATILQTGAKPILVDIGYDYNIDTKLIERKITKRTKAILPVHMNGRCCNMDDVMSIANKYRLIIIEDTAQAFSAKFKDRFAGTFGNAGCLSFHPMKVLGAFGDGGMVITNSDEINKNIRLWRNHGVDKSKNEHVCFGYNSRLDNIQAAILSVKLKHLDDWIFRRRKIYKTYFSKLYNLVLVPQPIEEGNYFDIAQNFVILFNSKHEKEQFIEYMANFSIEVMSFVATPINNSHYLPEIMCHLPFTESVINQGIMLPIYPELEDNDVNTIIFRTKEFIKGASE